MNTKLKNKLVIYLTHAVIFVVFAAIVWWASSLLPSPGTVLGAFCLVALLTIWLAGCLALVQSLGDSLKVQSTAQAKEPK